MVNNRLSPNTDNLSSREQPSEREIDILKAMAEGYTSKEIFGASTTCERKSLFYKLGARNVANLIYKAIERGYIKIEEKSTDKG